MQEIPLAKERIALPQILLEVTPDQGELMTIWCPWEPSVRESRELRRRMQWPICWM